MAKSAPTSRPGALSDEELAVLKEKLIAWISVE